MRRTAAVRAAGVLGNDARLDQVDGQWRMEGDPTEAALTTAAHKAGLDPESLRAEWPRLDLLAFESQHQYMATLHVRASDGARRIYIKGSAEAILARCTDALDENGRAAVEGEIWHRRGEAMASEGLAGVGLCLAEMPAHVHALGPGLVGRSDHVLGRTGAFEAVDQEDGQRRLTVRLPMAEAADLGIIGDAEEPLLLLGEFRGGGLGELGWRRHELADEPSAHHLHHHPLFFGEAWQLPERHAGLVLPNRLCPLMQVRERRAELARQEPL